MPLLPNASNSIFFLYNMLALNDSRQIAAMLVAPKAQKKAGAEAGLTGPQIRVLLAIVALIGENSRYIKASELYATKLYAPTRLRDYVRQLVEASCLTRRRRYSQYQLSLTLKGRKVSRDFMLITHRMAGAFIYP